MELGAVMFYAASVEGMKFSHIWRHQEVFREIEILIHIYLFWVGLELGIYKLHIIAPFLSFTTLLVFLVDPL